MPGIGNLFEPFLKGRTVLGVLNLVFIRFCVTVYIVMVYISIDTSAKLLPLRKSSLTTHLLNNAVDIPVLYIN